MVFPTFKGLLQILEANGMKFETMPEDGYWLTTITGHEQGSFLALEREEGIVARMNQFRFTEVPQDDRRYLLIRIFLLKEKLSYLIREKQWKIAMPDVFEKHSYPLRYDKKAD